MLGVGRVRIQRRVFETQGEKMDATCACVCVCVCLLQGPHGFVWELACCVPLHLRVTMRETVPVSLRLCPTPPPPPRPFPPPHPPRPPPTPTCSERVALESAYSCCSVAKSMDQSNVTRCDRGRARDTNTGSSCGGGGGAAAKSTAVAPPPPVLGPEIPVMPPPAPPPPLLDPAAASPIAASTSAPPAATAVAPATAGPPPAPPASAAAACCCCAACCCACCSCSCCAAGEVVVSKKRSAVYTSRLEGSARAQAIASSRRHGSRADTSQGTCGGGRGVCVKGGELEGGGMWGVEDWQGAM